MNQHLTAKDAIAYMESLYNDKGSKSPTRRMIFRQLAERSFAKLPNENTTYYQTVCCIFVFQPLFFEIILSKYELENQWSYKEFVYLQTDKTDIVSANITIKTL